MEERVKELFSNEEYVKGLVDLGSYEAAVAKLAEDGVETSVDELKKVVELINRKNSGELSDEELVDVAGGSILAGVGILVAGIGVGFGFPAAFNAIQRC